MKKLAPEEAARRMDNDPRSVAIELRELLRFTGLTPQELHSELASGALRAMGEPDGHGGYRNVAVCADDLTRWLASDRPLANKAYLRFMSEGDTPI